MVIFVDITSENEEIMMSEHTKDASSSAITPLSISEIDELLRSHKEVGIIQSPKTIEKKNSIFRMEDISQNVVRATQQMEDIFSYIKEKDNVPIKDIVNDIVPIMEEATEIPHVFHLFEELHEKSSYTFRHNICVGIIAGLIGKWFGLPEKQRKELELAGLLHDIGKVKIATELLHKSTKLTETEYNEIKKHPIFGYSLLRRTPYLADTISLVALQHHEREDGRGYPFRIKGSQIHLYSKIVAVADVFHAMSSDRSYRAALHFHDVIMKMDHDEFGKFDTKVMIIFLQNMMKTLVGKKVLLSDGSMGSVIMNHPYNPTKSIIQLEEGIIIDLQKHVDKKIMKVFNSVQ